MFHCFVPVPPISLSFILAKVLPRWRIWRVNLVQKTNSHRLQPGLMGSLIPVDTLAFVPQRQYISNCYFHIGSPSIIVPFHRYFRLSTAFIHILLKPFQQYFDCSERIFNWGDYTESTHALHRTTRSNTGAGRIAATAGTPLCLRLLCLWSVCYPEFFYNHNYPLKTV